MTKEQETLINSAAWLLCPMCDEDNCLGRFHCDQINEKVEEWKHKSEENT